MGNFKKKSVTSQEIPTSALPDIIFILLFFFMVTTTIRPSDIRLSARLPKVTQVEKLEQKNLITYIYIGKPLDKAKFGVEDKIQVNDTFVNPEDIPQFIEEERVKLGPDRDRLTVSLKIDKESKMGIITDVQQALRDADARKIVYAGVKTGSNF